MKENKNKHIPKTTLKSKENNTSTKANLQFLITQKDQTHYEIITILKENNISKIKITSKKTNKNHTKISLPFSIKWKNKEFKGTFTVLLNNNEIEECGIKWKSKSPNFGMLEDYIYEELEEKLTEIILKKYNTCQN
jgi:hypothetical protein